MKKIICVDNEHSKKLFEQVVDNNTKVVVIGEAVGSYGPCDLIILAFSDDRSNLKNDEWVSKVLALRLGPKGRIQLAY